MKKLVVLLSLVCVVGFSNAQVNDSLKVKEKNSEIKTVFGNKKAVHGGFGAISLGLSDVFKGRNALFTGVRGGWVYNHWFSFGLGGYSLLSGVQRDIGWDGPDPKSLEFYMGYGGIYLEPTLLPKFPVHLTFPVLLGAGGAVYIDALNNWDEDNSSYAYWQEDGDAFFIVEPGVDLEINFVKNIRFCLGAKYRYISDLNLIETEPDALNGLSYNISIKIGKF